MGLEDPIIPEVPKSTDTGLSKEISKEKAKQPAAEQTKKAAAMSPVPAAGSEVKLTGQVPAQKMGAPTGTAHTIPLKKAVESAKEQRQSIWATSFNRVMSLFGGTPVEEEVKEEQVTAPVSVAPAPEIAQEEKVVIKSLEAVKELAKTEETFCAELKENQKFWQALVKANPQDIAAKEFLKQTTALIKRSEEAIELFKELQASLPTDVRPSKEVAEQVTSRLAEFYGSSSFKEYREACVELSVLNAAASQKKISIPTKERVESFNPLGRMGKLREQVVAGTLKVPDAASLITVAQRMPRHQLLAKEIEKLFQTDSGLTSQGINAIVTQEVGTMNRAVGQNLDYLATYKGQIDSIVKGDVREALQAWRHQPLPPGAVTSFLVRDSLIKPLERLLTDRNEISTQIQRYKDEGIKEGIVGSLIESEQLLSDSIVGLQDWGTCADNPYLCAQQSLHNEILSTASSLSTYVENNPDDRMARAMLRSTTELLGDSQEMLDALRECVVLAKTNPAKAGEKLSVLYDIGGPFEKFAMASADVALISKMAASDDPEMSKIIDQQKRLGAAFADCRDKIADLEKAVQMSSTAESPSALRQSLARVEERANARLQKGEEFFTLIDKVISGGGEEASDKLADAMIALPYPRDGAIHTIADAFVLSRVNAPGSRIRHWNLAKETIAAFFGKGAAAGNKQPELPTELPPSSPALGGGRPLPPL